MELLRQAIGTISAERVEPNPKYVDDPYVGRYYQTKQRRPYKVLKRLNDLQYWVEEQGSHERSRVGIKYIKHTFSKGREIFLVRCPACDQNGILPQFDYLCIECRRGLDA